MFGELLESRARRTRNRAGVVASVSGHAIVIALAVIATRTHLTARVPDERIVPLPVLPPHSPLDAPAPMSPARTPRHPMQPVVGPVMVPPIDVPDGIVPMDARYDIPVPGPSEWSWGALGASDTAARSSSSGRPGDGGIPFAGGVEKPAMAVSDNPPPKYPELLRRNGVRGEVTIEVVVDTTGRAQMESLRIIGSDHPLLSDAVSLALARARFLPAETRGRKVRMWVRQSFVFEVR